MIVNHDTGEILDLSPLRHKPRGRKTKRLDQRRFKSHSQKQYEETAVVLSLVAIIAVAVSIMV